MESRHSPKARKTRLALIVDPRFSGGTSSAVAREIRTLAPHFDLEVHALETAMFKGRTPNPAIAEILAEEGLDLIWNARQIRAEIAVLHNPSCLKFNKDLATRIHCGSFFTVAHENFLRPSGEEGYDVGLCLDLLASRVLAARLFIAPISGYNRRGVNAWLADNPRDWRVTDFDWFNICDFEFLEPGTPADRRGRHSRAGFEKFPAMDAMEAAFPATASACRILGGDSFLMDPQGIPAHWDVLPFGAEKVDAFLGSIDFFVYYTSPGCQESFGRVIAEAIAAGKLVITDDRTAEAFGPAVRIAAPHEVDAVVAGYVAKPETYARFVRRAQSHLGAFSSGAFLRRITNAFSDLQDLPNDLL